MKRTIFFLTLLALVSCTCLPQIPPQTIYADEYCEGVLPNYLQWITVKDNCQGAIPTQDPLPGTILDAANPWVTVTIEVKDMSGNSDRERFDAILLDTVPPELIIDSALLSYTGEQRSLLLRAYHTSLGYDMYKAAQDSIWLGADVEFDTKSMLMVTSPGFGGSSWGTFIDPGKYIMTLDSNQLAQLGYYTIKLQFIDPAQLPLTINSGMDTEEWYTKSMASYNYLLNLPAMYESERYGDFSYSLPVGPGHYEVELHFAEIYWSDPGKRVFDVKIQDEWVLEGYDIVVDVGAERAVVKRFNTVTMNGWLNIQFLSKVDYAKISGIVIRKTGTLAGL